MLERYFLMKPTRRAIIEWTALNAAGIIGLNLPSLPLEPYTNFAGIALIIVGWYIHYTAHKIHRQAHERYDKIQRIVCTGIYSKIRHPCYLGVILMYIGVGLAWGSYISLAFALFFSTLTAITAIYEERALCKRFKEYEEYMKKVKWRFIPGLF